MNCPKCGTPMEEGRHTVTQDEKVIRNFRCPKCGHRESKKED